MDIAEILESGISGLSSVTEITILTFKNVTSKMMKLTVVLLSKCPKIYGKMRSTNR